jgi:hypothetical protein
MSLVRQLEEIELRGSPSVFVREEGESGSETGAERTIHVWLIDRDDGDPSILALDLLLHLDEPTDANLLLRAPPPAYEAENEGLAIRDVVERERGTGVVGERQFRKNGSLERGRLA